MGCNFPMSLSPRFARWLSTSSVKSPTVRLGPTIWSGRRSTALTCPKIRFKPKSFFGLDHRVGHFMSMMFQIRGESTPSGFQIRIAIGERSRHP